MSTSSAPRTVNTYAGFEKGGAVKLWQYESHPARAVDVKIQILHCGICGADVHMLDCSWGPTEYPCIVGHETIGHTTVTGEDVKHLAVGGHVGVGAQAWACLNKNASRLYTDCAIGLSAHCSRAVRTNSSKYENGAASYGGYADFVRVSSHYAFKISDAIPSDVTAPLMCAGVSVFVPVKHYVKAEDCVGAIGIGGLGHLAIQFIRAVNAVPVAFSRSANKELEIRALGAQDIYNLGVIRMTPPEPSRPSMCCLSRSTPTTCRTICTSVCCAHAARA